MRTETYIRILQIFLIVISGLYGGFYEYVACIAGIFLCICFLIIIQKRNSVIINISYSTVALTLVAVCYAGSCFFAVDRGMAIFGGVKFGTIFLFLICVLQISAEERIRLLHVVPVTGCIIVVIGGFSLITGSLKDMLFLSGRFGGTFQYSNTMALYFLIGITVLQFIKLNQRRYVVGVYILYCGILMTGSRSVFILSTILLIFWGGYKRNVRWFLLALPIISVVAGNVYVSITSDFQNIGRFLTVSLKSSTFLGRLLYWQDGLKIIMDYPWGLGYEGYKYMQSQYQTGVYAVEFIHNDWLQLALDIGLIPMCIMLGALVIGLVSKKNTTMQKLVLTLIAVHSFFDFDLQYLLFFYIMILSMDLDGKRMVYVIKKKGEGVLCKACIGVFCCALFYFMLPLFCFYRNEYQSALELYPLYTEAKVELLKNCDSLEEAELLADSIIKANPYVSISYDAKAVVASYKNNYDSVIMNKEKAIQNAPYIKAEYIDYAILLSSGIDYYKERGEQEKCEKCRANLLKIPRMMSDTEKRTSNLGREICDKPDLELPQEIQDYIRALS